MRNRMLVDLYGMVKDESLDLEKRAEAAREYYKRQGIDVLASDYAIVTNF